MSNIYFIVEIVSTVVKC